MRALIRASLVLPVVAVLLLSGCGDDQVKVNNAYVSATDRAMQAFETEFQQLQTSFTAVSTPAQDLRTLTALQAAVDRVVADLTKVTPPAKIAPLHARLIQQVQRYRAIIQTAKRAFASDDPRRVISARSRFSAALAGVATQVSATINTINERLR
ncbi:MAG: hypothetical protein JWN65_4174 [Solirubrobacterales bacterium]|jgi:uncharacterized lipoprotein|nr:hypothetical protein [Solirubrobacterales bacterium]